jgi:AcrR family transcriptional regulator
MNPPRQYLMSTRADAVASTRERIVAAATSLFIEQAYEDVTLAAIAAAAGVSHQTVLNHFESKEGVVLGVAEALKGQTVTARHAAKPGDVAAAVGALVGEYEWMGDANVRWAVTADRFEGLAAILDDARVGHQDWIVAMFGDDMPTSPVARRRAVLALHAVTDVYTWKLLRRDLGQSRKETEKIMAGLVVGVLKGNGS